LRNSNAQWHTSRDTKGNMKFHNSRTNHADELTSVKG
jgi:hypothetical protein